MKIPGRPRGPKKTVRMFNIPAADLLKFRAFARNSKLTYDGAIESAIAQYLDRLESGYPAVVTSSEGRRARQPFHITVGLADRLDAWREKNKTSFSTIALSAMIHWMQEVQNENT